MKSTFLKIYLVFTGILMGIADTLPGVSGSTITYILGVYEKFIESISNLTHKDKFLKSFLYLFNIGIGWFFGALLSIILLNKFATDHIYFITSLFLGLVIMTIYKTYRDIKNIDGFSGKAINFLIAGIFITIIMFFFGWDMFTLFDGPLLYVYVFVVSIIAVSCMLLPGVSGSTILLVFGLYYPVINTLNSILKGEFINISFLVVFFVGVIIGLFGCAKIINKLFHKHKVNGLNLILGILIGSIIPIIYGPLGIDGKNYNMLNFSNISIVGLILGILILVGLNKLNDIKEKRLDNVE